MVFVGRLLGLLLCCHVATAQHEPKPNVVFIVIDDFRPAIGAYGDSLAITPNMDQLAREGVLFERAYAQQALCSPSRTSFLTGLRPDATGVYNNIKHFRENKPDIITLPGAFKREGYSTIGIGKIFHSGKGMTDPRSWSEELFSESKGVSKEYALPENIGWKKKPPAVEQADVQDNAYPDGRSTDEAVSSLEKFAGSGKPFFLAVGYIRPHLPFAAPSRYWDLYNRGDFYPLRDTSRAEDAPRIAFDKPEELRKFYSGVPGEGPVSPEKQGELRHGYYACISFIDAQVGRVLRTLDSLQLRKNTIVVLLGDHGYHLGEQRLWAKETNLERDLRIPLIISTPDRTHSGVKSQSIVEAIDIYPTLLGLSGISPATHLSGISLKPLLMEPGRKERDAVAFSQYPRPWPNNAVSYSHMGYTVRTDEWRYTAWYNFKTGEFEYRELYAMKTQMVETNNLAGDKRYAAVEKKLFRLVNRYREGL